MAENKIVLNPAQQKAVDFPHDKPAIVTAAAGSGKTTLLVKRVVRLIADEKLNIPASSLAIMTFTKNATKNMRESLNRALNSEIESLADKSSSEEKEKYDYLKKQIFDLRRAAISTIDAFCLRMIKENAESFDLPVNVSVMDNARKAALQSQAMKAAWQEFYGESFSKEERDALFFSFSFENDESLEKNIHAAAEKLSNYPDPEKWIENAKNAYKDIPTIEKTFLPLLDNFLEINIFAAEKSVREYSEKNVYDDLYNAVQAEIAVKETPALKNMVKNVLPSLEKYIAFDENRVDILKRDYAAYKSSRTIAALSRLVENLQCNSKQPPEKYANNGTKYSAKKEFKRISDEVEDKIQNLLEININAEYEESGLETVQKTLGSFFKLLQIYMHCYETEKRNAGCIDFSDCERELYNKLSCDNEFRQQLLKRFSCIIVDEFQDSNNIQAKIFELLGEGRLFYVGDVKQSIYSFRGADPYIMAKLCDDKDSVFEKLPLNTNYRSRKAVIDTVNAAFDGLMTPKYGGVDYSDNNGLNLGCDLPEPENKELYNSELFLVAGTKSDNEDDDKNMTLARLTAKKIKELHDNKEFLVSAGKENDGYKLRRAEYSDFIILLRTNKKIDCYRKALAELGISSTVPKGSNFFEAEEILLAINYLKIIDNPLLNEEMLKTLMSPIYRFTAEEMAQIKMGILGINGADDKELKKISKTYKTRSLYSCIADCMTQSVRRGKEKIAVKRTISTKLARFVSDLKSFRYFMNSNSLDNLIRKIYDDTDLIAVVSAFEDSAGRIENIRRLQRMALEFEARGGGSLGDFLRFLDRAKENSNKGVEEAARPESGANAVRIMTFHGSKGLEAPVCVISELQYQMNKSDYTNDLVMDFDNYIAIKHTDIKHRRKTKTAAYHALSRFIRERQLGDELRLLYVAMTRAKEKLIMISTLNKAGYESFDKFLLQNQIADDLHDIVYEESAPFKCVLKSLATCAPSINESEKEVVINDIELKITALNIAENKKICEEEKIDIEVSTEENQFEVSKADVDEISEIIAKKYEHIDDTLQQAKFTATELAHKKSARPISLTKPYFACGGKVTGVEKGNAYHHFMQYFPLEHIHSGMRFDVILKIVSEALDEMTASKKITEDERDIIDVIHAANFFQNDLGQRLLRVYEQNPDNVKREQSFFAEVNGDEVRQDYKKRLSIQGQIDLYFIENGEIVVVDYKTDTIENLAKEQKNYEFQVEIYTKILGKLTGMKVKEMYLYAFLADGELKI